MGAFWASLSSCLLVLRTLWLVSSYLPPPAPLSFTLARQRTTRRSRLIVPQLAELWLNSLGPGPGLISFCPIPLPTPLLGWRPWVPGSGKTDVAPRLAPALAVPADATPALSTLEKSQARSLARDLLSQGPLGPASCPLDTADILGAFGGQAAQRPATIWRLRLGPGPSSAPGPQATTRFANPGPLPAPWSLLCSPPTPHPEWVCQPLAAVPVAACCYPAVPLPSRSPFTNVWLFMFCRQFLDSDIPRYHFCPLV